jgi:hypothetical protein
LRGEAGRAWCDAAAAAQDAITRYARAEGLNRFEVAQELRRTVGEFGSASSP